jgi:hypothetical protein
MGGCSSRCIGAGKSLAIVGGKWGAFSTQFARRSREGNRWLEFRIPCANAFTGPLPWPVHGARALPSVSCVACWNEQRALGFAEGPLCSGVARGQGRAELRRFSPFTHDPPRSKKEAVDRGGAPGGACAVRTFQRLRARVAAAMQRVTPSIYRRCKGYALDNVLKFEQFLEALVAPSASAN